MREFVATNSNETIQNIKTFSNILPSFTNQQEILSILKQSWPSCPVYFGDCRLWNAWLHKCLNSPVSYQNSTVNMLEGLKDLWNFHESTIKLFCISEGNWPRKPLLLLIFGLLQLFVKILTADDKYSLCNIWNLQDFIQMQLSKKLKSFVVFFLLFLKSASNFKHLTKTMNLIAYAFWKFQTVKDMVRQMF